MLSVCSKMYRVSIAWRSHTRSTIRVACIDLTLAIFSMGHRCYWEDFILVAIDYFKKWVEATSYAKLNAARVATFIRLHIIYIYGVPHELISDRGVHFRGKVDTLLKIWHLASEIVYVQAVDKWGSKGRK